MSEALDKGYTVFNRSSTGVGIRGGKKNFCVKGKKKKEFNSGKTRNFNHRDSLIPVFDVRETCLGPSSRLPLPPINIWLDDK